MHFIKSKAKLHAYILYILHFGFCFIFVKIWIPNLTHVLKICLIKGITKHSKFWF